MRCGATEAAGEAAEELQALASAFPTIVLQAVAAQALGRVQLAMGNFSNFYATDQAVLFAGLATAMVPPLLVFAVLQRSFIEGLTVGALRD